MAILVAEGFHLTYLRFPVTGSEWYSPTIYQWPLQDPWSALLVFLTPIPVFASIWALRNRSVVTRLVLFGFIAVGCYLFLLGLTPFTPLVFAVLLGLGGNVVATEYLCSHVFAPVPKDCIPDARIIAGLRMKHQKYLMSAQQTMWFAAAMLIALITTTVTLLAPPQGSETSPASVKARSLIQLGLMIASSTCWAGLWLFGPTARFHEAIRTIEDYLIGVY